VSTNRLRAALTRVPTAFGAWCTLASPFAAELCALEQVDYVCVDLQHGAGYLDNVVAMLMAISHGPASPIVRVLSNEASQIGKVLDAGAEAVIVPLVNSRSEAERAVAACRYAPEGARSHGPFRAGLFLNKAPHAEVNREVLCLVMIETVAALESADEICSTPGLDGVYVGPSDLAVSMGYSPGFEELPPSHREAIEHIRRTCTSRGLISGIHTYGGQEARVFAAQGFNMVTLASDAALLRGALRENIEIARHEQSASTPSSPPLEHGA